MLSHKYITNTGSLKSGCNCSDVTHLFLKPLDEQNHAGCKTKRDKEGLMICDRQTISQ